MLGVSTKHFRPNEVTAEIELWLEMITTQVMSRLWPPALFIATCLLFLVVRHRRSLNIHLEVPLPQTSPPISSDPVSTLAGLAAISPPVPINDTCLSPALPLLPKMPPARPEPEAAVRQIYCLTFCLLTGCMTSSVLPSWLLSCQITGWGPGMYQAHIPSNVIAMMSNKKKV